MKTLSRESTLGFLQQRLPVGLAAAERGKTGEIIAKHVRFMATGLPPAGKVRTAVR